MSTLSVINESQHATLPPGFYWIEMAFDRPASVEVLLRALRSIGFDSVGVEMDDPPPAQIGSLATAAAMAARPPLVTARASASSATQAALAAAPRASAVSTTPSFVAPSRAAAMPPLPIPAGQGVDLRVPDAPPPARAPAAAPTQRASTARDFSAAYPPPRYKEGGGGGGGRAPAAPAAPSTSPGGAYEPPPGAGPSAGPADALGPDPYGEQPYEGPGSYADEEQPGGGGGGGGGGGFYEPGAPGDEEQAPAPRASTARAPLTTRTASITSPVALSRTTAPPVQGAVRINPSGASPMWLCPLGSKCEDVTISGRRLIVGGEPESEGVSFRFVAQLGHAIDIKSLPGLRWTIVHALEFDPWGPMSFRLTPHTLTNGQLYDLRFLSRDKTAKSKRDVLALLTTMGFRPATIFLSKRNMRIPGRPLTTLSEWFGVGRWVGPDSVIVSSDPFYFAEVRPTS